MVNTIENTTTERHHSLNTVTITIAHYLIRAIRINAFKISISNSLCTTFGRIEAIKEVLKVKASPKATNR
jgi:hypothetical protein